MKVVDRFDQTGWTPARWDLAAPTVFQTWDWLRTWWHAFGRGELVIVANDSAVLPLFLDGGMLYLVGAGNSDYLDFPSESPEQTWLSAAVRLALSTTSASGLRWYLLRQDSPTTDMLYTAGRSLGMSVHIEDSITAPSMHLDRQAVQRRSLRRATRWLQANGTLVVDRPRAATAVAALPALFDQHRRRWAGHPTASTFDCPALRDFHVELAGKDPSWLRMTRLCWNGAPVAQHIGMSFKGRYLWYKPTFEPALSQRSPGTALLHQLVQDGIDEGCRTFDFGIGDEAFKDRYADHTVAVDTVAMYT